MGDSTPAIKIHLHVTSADDSVMARGLYDAINELADVVPIVKLVEYDGVWDPFSTPDTPETTGKGRG